MHSLEAKTSVALVKWSSHANGTLVEAPVVYAKIPGYSSSGNFTMRLRGYIWQDS